MFAQIDERDFFDEEEGSVPFSARTSLLEKVGSSSEILTTPHPWGDGRFQRIKRTVFPDGTTSRTVLGEVDPATGQLTPKKDHDGGRRSSK